MKRKVPMAGKGFQIRNSTIDFLVFTKQNLTDSVQVRIHDKNAWLTQKSMVQLFKCSTDNTSLHLKSIFRDGGLILEAVIGESPATASDEEQYKTKFYNLNTIISAGYRINSLKVIQFHQQATKVLRTYTVQEYVFNERRLENGQIFGEEYFEHLPDEIREVRVGERRSYQKMTDIYAMTVGCSRDIVATEGFFKTVQNKPHYVIHGHTATGVIVERADHKKEHMGLTTWKSIPGGRIVRADVSIAENHLSQSELQDLNQFVSIYLDHTEGRAERHVPMATKGQTIKLGVSLKVNGEDILLDKGKVTHEIAKTSAESEFEKCKMIQGQLCESDFDKSVMKVNLQ